MGLNIANLPPTPPPGQDEGAGLSWSDYWNMAVGLANGQIAAGQPVAHWTAKHAVQTHGYSIVWKLLVGLVDDILTFGVELITKLQGQDNPEFYNLMQALIEDLLGVQFQPNAIQSAWQHGGDVAAVKAGGALFLGRLAEEMHAPLPPAAGPGLSAAEGLLGYIMAFSVREANVSTILSLIPEEYRVFDGIRDYAVDLARNLGLGRICRQAMMPYIKQAIQDPMTRELNAQFRPTKLGAMAAIRAHNRGAMSDADLATELAVEGHSDVNQQALKKDALTQLTDGDAWTLYKNGKIDGNTLAQDLQNAGLDPGAIGDYVTAQVCKQIEPWDTALLNDWKAELAAGYIDLATFESQVQGMAWPQDVKDAIKHAVGDLYEFPRKALTLAEVQSAFVEGIYDLEDLAAWFKRQGYSSDDSDVLTQLTLIKLGTQSAKVAVARYTWDKAKAKAAAKGEPEPPMPAILATL